MFCAVGTWLTDDPVEENTLRIALLICVATFAILTKLDGWSNKMGGRE